jgi:hypothetical protein
MKTAGGDELMGALVELRPLFPDWRVGQLIASLTQAAGRTEDGAVWEVEDEQLLESARRLIERNQARKVFHD